MFNSIVLIALLIPTPDPPVSADAPALLRPAVADTVSEPRGPEIIRTEEFSMRLAASLQVLYAFTDLEAAPSNGSFRIRRGRLSLAGSAYEHFDYRIQIELAGASVRLLDANIRYHLAPYATLWFGQGKAYMGRQRLVSSANLNFVDRTLVDDRFSLGRQTGLALLLRDGAETLEANLGVYNGTGINQPNVGGNYLSVARAVWTPLGAYSPVESAHDYPESPRVALGGSVARTTVGTGFGRTRVTRFNVESAYKIYGFNAMAEVYRERAAPANGGPVAWTTGWYIQPGLLLSDRTYEVALRFGEIAPSGVPDADQTETGVAVSRYLSGHRAKIQSDLRWIHREAVDATDLEARVQVQLAF